MEIKNKLKNAGRKIKQFAADNQVSIGILIGGAVAVTTRIIMDRYESKVREEMWDVAEAEAVIELGEATIVTRKRDGKFMFFTPDENQPED